METDLTTEPKTWALATAPAGKPTKTTVPQDLTYSVDCSMAFSETETLMTPCGPPLVAFWTAAMISFSLVKSMKISPPNSWNNFFLSSPPSIPRTLKPIALAY
ncbi:hypothetical protein WICPIJ_006971 [Wickerhamomyces pijperi]|uniref:Uncharacterized protein n=1 Tax=Wickerhamomyces pijperi TaxID=599730 RepID=A0A9P8TKH8_WICPI|nr:hypothetical protein WICPIJ_006971 [Wickerhamomyces pijperi]